MKKLMYIALFLIMAANLLAQESYVIDSVCIGADRTYRMNGEKGSTYDWFIEDELGNPVANPVHIDFEVINSPGDTIRGSEITHNWDAIGEFTIITYHWSEHGCDTLEQGMVKVFDPPQAEAGPPDILCTIDDIYLTGDTVWSYSVLFWETLGDGSFNVVDQLHPIYSPGPGDINTGNVTLVLTSYGLAQNSTCEPAVDSVTFEISQPEISLNVYPLLCYGENTASIGAQVTGGKKDYTYSWTGPNGFTSSADSITNLSAGTYILTLTDANNCVDIDTALIIEPPEMFVSIDNVIDVSCYGASDGEIQSSASGGTGNLTFAWKGLNTGYSSSAEILSGLAADIYELTVTDENLCTIIDSVEIKEPEKMLADITISIPVTCYGGNDGAAFVIAGKGTPPYTYEWSTDPPQDSIWAVDLSEGQYFVTVTDFRGCQETDSVYISQPTDIVVSADSIDIRCSGAKPGEIHLQVDGGTPFATQPYYRYEWTNESGAVVGNSRDLYDITVPGWYTVTVSDFRGCEKEHKVLINEEPEMNLISVVDSVFCYGDLWSVEMTVTNGKEPYEYMWMNGTTIIDTLNEDLENVTGGDYLFVVTDANGCQKSQDFNLVDPAPFVVDLVADDTDLCEGEVAQLNADVTGGIGTLSYWYNGDSTSYLSATNIADPAFTGLLPDVYALNVLVQDENACTARDTLEITVHPPTEGTIDTLLCQGAPTFDWYSHLVETTQDTMYVDTLVNAMGCDSILTLNLNVLPPSDTLIDTVLCEGTPAFDWGAHLIESFVDSVYTDTLTSVIGCDSLVTLNVSIASPSYAADTLELCEGSAPFPWNSHWVEVLRDSTYIDTLTNAANCDSIVSLDLTVLYNSPDTHTDTAIYEADLPFVWQGKAYTESESDWIVFLNEAGCDSLLTLDLTVIGPVVNTDTVPICRPDLPYFWNDSLYYEAGIHRDTLINTAGNDSIVALDLIVFETSIGPETVVTINDISLPYFWQGNPYTETTQDTLILQNAAGCDSLLTLDLTVIPFVPGTVYDSVCRPDLPYEWNSKLYNDAGIFPDTLITSAGLDSIVILDLTVFETSEGPVLRDTVYDIDLPYAWKNFNDITADGRYTYDTINSVGCDSLVYLDLTILTYVPDTVPESVCRPDLPYVWDWNGESYYTEDIYTDTLTTVSGNKLIRSLDLTILETSIGPITDTTVYDYELPYAWRDVEYIQEGIYYDVVPNSVGCDSLLTLDLKVIETDIEAYYVNSCGPYYWTCTDETYTKSDIYDCGVGGRVIRIYLTIHPEIELSETHIDDDAKPELAGAIDLTINGGTEPFAIEWSNGESTEDISGLSADSYSVVVSDEYCIDSLDVEILKEELVFTMDCPDAETVECVTELPAPAQNFYEYLALGGSASSNCGIDTLSFLHLKDSSDNLPCPETIYRSYEVKDVCGNTRTCRQIIVIQDITPPVMVCMPSDTVECISELPQSVKTLSDFFAAGGEASDNCALDSSSFTFTEEVNVYDEYTERVATYGILDMCGHEATCKRVLVVTDTIPPSAVCTNITVYLDRDGNYVLTDIDMSEITASTTDNCTSEDFPVIEVDVDQLTCEDVESGKVVHVTVTDEAGRSDDCQASITILDTIPPEAICKPATVYLDENGFASITLDMINNGSRDNCRLDSITISPNQFDCSSVGENSVQLIATDAYGLKDTCEAIVTVLDQVPPVISCLPEHVIQLGPDGTYPLTLEMVVDSVFDDCGIDTILLESDQLDCSNIGRTYITVTAFDASGNRSECQIPFVVYGNIPPNVVNDSAVTAMDIPVEINVISNDYDLKTNINLSTLGVLVEPGHGSVVVDNQTGIVTYTPNAGYVGPDLFRYKICDDAIPCEEMCGDAIVFVTVRPANEPPLAVDDYFDVPCGNLYENVLKNDSDPDGDEISVFPVPITRPTNGVLTLYDNGNFEYEPFPDFAGVDSFQYEIRDHGLPPVLYDTAWVYITRVPDNDCDGIADIDDIDDDNDGIRDVNEGDGMFDSDNDGIVDSWDIDSDNDGILDNIEGQGEHDYIAPDGWIDENNNGWDDRYDHEQGGYPFDEDLTDTDGDGTPDFLDINSDDDGVFDFIEGHDENADGIPDVTRYYSDLDRDGLDDAYDLINGWGIPDFIDNETGSNAPLQDFDGDGTRDWRDINDEDDEYLTVNEDLNGDGDYSNDDLDLDGHPEYLDVEINCELFIPEGFSPNNDGVHDFFQILCIYPRYPNAKLMIFNRQGQKIFEKENYGNFDVWGWDDAWWWGSSDHVLTIGRSGGLPAGNYVYVLELNDGTGDVRNGTVMLAY